MKLEASGLSDAYHGADRYRVNRPNLLLDKNLQRNRCAESVLRGYRPVFPGFIPKNYFF